MAANATIVSIGGVSVTSSGGLTGDRLFQAQQAVQAAAADVNNLVIVSLKDGSIPAAPTFPGAKPVLVIQSNYTGPLVIPSGYAFVVYSGTGQITGGDANTVLIGDLNYSGGVGTVLAGGTGTQSGGGVVNDTLAGAVLSFFTGTYTVTSNADRQSLIFDSPARAIATVTGNNSSVILGTPQNSGGGSTVVAQPRASSLLMQGDNGVVSLSGVAASVDGGAYESAVVSVTGQHTTLIANGSSMYSNIALKSDAKLFQSAGTVFATQITGASMFYDGSAGTASSLVAYLFDNVGGSTIRGSSGFTEYAVRPVDFTGAQASTVFGGTGGTDLIFAGSAVYYDGSAAAQTTFVASDYASTIVGATKSQFVSSVKAGASAVVFDNNVGGTFTVGSTSFFFGGGGGADTINTGAGTSRNLMFGHSNENMTIVSSPGVASVLGSTFAAYGDANTINAAGAAGGNTFFAVNQHLAIGEYAGNSTLIGSSAGKDGFVVFVDSKNLSQVAHTITIENWQSTDSMFVGDLGNANNALNAADKASIDAFNAGTSNSFSLHDGTTITFVGARPTSTQISHN